MWSGISSGVFWRRPPPPLPGRALHTPAPAWTGGSPCQPYSATLGLLFLYHSSEASILRCSAFFMAQLSHPYMTTGKTIALTRRTFVSNRNITLPTKVRLVKAMVFPVVMYGCESWAIKKAECEKTDAFDLWCGEDTITIYSDSGAQKNKVSHCFPIYFP